VYTFRSTILLTWRVPSLHSSVYTVGLCLRCWSRRVYHPHYWVYVPTTMRYYKFFTDGASAAQSRRMEGLLDSVGSVQYCEQEERFYWEMGVYPDPIIGQGNDIPILRLVVKVAHLSTTVSRRQTVHTP
jgi:hypothetical protein